MSAAGRRDSQRDWYNATLAGCPGHEAVALLSDKWVTLVISALADGPLRHSELARAVAGATQKMLTQTLRKLERDGLVARLVTPTIPVRVDYELTSIGHSLLPVQRGIQAWGEAHIDDIRAARANYEHDSDTGRRSSNPSSNAGR